MKHLVLAGLVLAACKSEPPKMTMTPDEVIGAMHDYADRGCACDTDKECFREVRDDWEANRKSILFNAKLLTGDQKNAYDEERKRFGLCGDAAGLAVFDNV